MAFQVYNNTYRNEDADTAVDETKGRAVYYDDEIVKNILLFNVMWYSTDVCAWGSDDSCYPMYGSTHIGSGGVDAEMSDNTEFERYIEESHDCDYDSGFPLYRLEIRQ